VPKSEEADSGGFDPRLVTSSQTILRHYLDTEMMESTDASGASQERKEAKDGKAGKDKRMAKDNAFRKKNHTGWTRTLDELNRGVTSLRTSFFEGSEQGEEVGFQKKGSTSTKFIPGADSRLMIPAGRRAIAAKFYPLMKKYCKHQINWDDPTAKSESQIAMNLLIHTDTDFTVCFNMLVFHTFMSNLNWSFGIRSHLFDGLRYRDYYGLTDAELEEFRQRHAVRDVDISGDFLERRALQEATDIVNNGPAPLLTNDTLTDHFNDIHSNDHFNGTDASLDYSTADYSTAFTEGKGKSAVRLTRSQSSLKSKVRLSSTDQWLDNPQRGSLSDSQWERVAPKCGKLSYD
jgi:hypothetical protein